MTPRVLDLLDGAKVTLPARFWSRVDRGGPGGCWLWTGPLTKGYGRIHVHGERHGLVHRVAYELMVGPIPDGLTLDHLCRTRNCVNPRHLEPVTAAENTRRGFAPSIVASRTRICKRGHVLPREGGRCLTCRELHNQARRSPRIPKTHCPQGHPYDDTNSYFIKSRPGIRYCRACRDYRNRTYRRPA